MSRATTIVVVSVCFLVPLEAAAIVKLIYETQQTVNQIQVERHDSLFRSCLTTNKEHKANVNFAASQGGSRKAAFKAYPYVSEKFVKAYCETYANSRVKVSNEPTSP